MSIIEKLNASRKELLDLGLRNPLINFRTRKGKVDVVDEISHEIFRILVIDNKKMSFSPVPDKALSDDDGELLELFSEEDADWSKLFSEDDGNTSDNGLAGRHTDTRLQTKMGASSLHARLLTMHNGANTFIQEQGVNILYLALGFLHWYEDDNSDKKRIAPLLLIPVEIKRASAKEKFQLSYTGNDIGPNLSLYEKFKNEFAIKLPEFDEQDTVDVDDYFTQVENCIAGQNRWKVSRDEMVLGFFSFGKFLMYKDLDHETWPEGKRPQDHSIVQALLSEGFRNETPLVSDESHIDDLLSPQDVNLVMDADSSQTLAILDINSGQNMVIQGPPGTGKSQTITNVIAEAIGLDKKVLFVSEKMSALEVVKRRLDAVGLGDAVLELHSHKTNKRALIDELKRTINLGKPIVGNINDDIQSLTEMRDRLNAYCEAVNKPILNSSITPIDAIGLYKGLGDEVTSLPRIDFSEMKDWDMGDFKSNRLRVEELQRRLIEMGVPSKNSFWGIKRTVLLPTENEKLKQMLVDVIKSVEMHRANSCELAKQLFLDEPNSNHEVSMICRAALRASEAPKLEGVRVDSGD
ncbi:MAG: DUF4011 domain-containing protein, partial [Methylococcales bacterium]|nr:DUF4011 domain-containing protein [Methylococcales bacterium]